MNKDLNEQRMRRLRRLATVPRWTVVPTIKAQSVAEHSFQVAVIALWVARYHNTLYNGSADEQIMYYALIHEELESWYSDLPSPARAQHMPNKHSFEEKGGFGQTPANNDVKIVLKVADMLEAYLFAKEECDFGSKYMEAIIEDIHQKLLTTLKEFPFCDTEDKFSFITQFMQCFDISIHPVMEMNQ